MPSAPRLYVVSTAGANDPLRQGEICSELIQVHLAVDTVGLAESAVEQKVHPYAVILTQDCDLEQDFKARHGQNKPDKMIPNLLFCEIVTAEQLRGTTGITSELWKRIRQNKDERYHFLQKVEPGDDAAGKGLPELGMDFKRYFTLPTEEVYKRIEIGEAKRRCVLVSPYLEHLSTRFAAFLSRVALPQDHATM